jgi:hypothetical protein
LGLLHSGEKIKAAFLLLQLLHEISFQSQQQVLVLNDFLILLEMSVIIAEER